jgi:uncharacterized protein YkwD
MLLAALLAGAALATSHAWTFPAQRAVADAGANSDLFALTNQDRASNGLPALQLGTISQGIAEGRPYGGCGFAVNGRAVDMIQRSYFAHPILNCGGQNVFNMLNAFGVSYRSAGENIGWASNAGGASGSANYVNNAFMNSPDHRANILNGSYTHLGIGSAHGASWQGNSDVWMFAQVFTQDNSAPPPPPPPPPAPPQPTAPPSPPPRHDPPPTPSLPAPEVTPAPPTPTPEPAPPPPAPQPAGLLRPPLLWQSGGLLHDSVESVLEAFLL